MAGKYRKTFCVGKYLDCSQGRIFSIVNLPENTGLFEHVYKDITPKDRFLVIFSWMHPEQWFKKTDEMFVEYGLNKDQFYMMANTQEQLELCLAHGFDHSYFINRHFNFDYDTCHVDLDAVKNYDVCIFGESLPRNNIPLAFHLNNLVFLTGTRLNEEWYYPNHVDIVSTEKTNNPVNHPLIQETIRSSKIGLSLAERDSMCWSVIEFFMNGIPLVTTRCDSGRLEWCNKYNSIIIESTDPPAITRGVNEMLERLPDIDPEQIRDYAIADSEFFRAEFKKLIHDVYLSLNLYVDPTVWFNKHYTQRFMYEQNWKNEENSIAVFK